MNRIERLITLAVLFLAQTVGAQTPSPQPRPEPVHGPDTKRPGPWDQDVLVYRVPAGGGVPEKVATFGRAGVPTIARMKDGRLIAAHQHFPENDRGAFDKVAVRFSPDEGRTWTDPAVIRLDGLPEGMRFPFDPTLVPLPDGRVRLYFTSTKGRTFEDGVPAIYSAISDDGVRYSFEPGRRFGVEGRFVIDCAVVLHRGKFHLFSPDNGEARRPEGFSAGPPEPRGQDGLGYHAASEDGLAFTRVEDVRIEGRRKWLGNARSDGKIITFYGTGGGPPPGGEPPRRPPEPPAGGEPGAPPMPKGGAIWTATSEDGMNWTLGKAIAVPGADPGAVAVPDGGLIVVVTGPPRPGTPSANRRR